MMFQEERKCVVHGAQKSFNLVWLGYQLSSGFLANAHLLRVLRQSGLPANDKGDNEMILGAVHRCPGICLTAEENPRKPQLGDRLMELCDQSSSQMGPLSFK